jgi:hypothetical protein
MTEYSQNQNNPTGIWQHIWVTLTLQAIEQYSKKQYLSMWETLKILKKEIPPECEKDCEVQYTKITQIVQEINKITGNKLQSVKDTYAYRVYRDLPEPLLDLLGQIRKSLFEKGWINKNFQIQPLSTKKPHMGEQKQDE